MDYEVDDWSVAIDIGSVPPSSACRILSWALPVAVELGSDISTSSNGGTPSLLLHTVPLPFFDDPDASQLSTSINGFRLDDCTA